MSERPTNLPFGWVLTACSGVALAAFGWALMGGRGSLWVDELHTSWVIAGPAGELVERAAAGNQSPWYFYIVSGFGQLLSTVSRAVSSSPVSPELALRLPSMAAWSISVGLGTGILLISSARKSPWMVRHGPTDAIRDENTEFSRTASSALKAGIRKVGGNIGHLGPIIGWSCCILIDRLQWFYGSEARVYAILQLLSLINWLFVAILLSTMPVQAARSTTPQYVKTSRGWLWIVWAVVAASLLHLHVTSLPSVLVQFCLLSIAAICNSRYRYFWMLSGFLIATSGWLVAGEMRPVWERRAQWESVGGDASFEALLTVVPVLPILGPVTLAWLVVVSQRWIMHRRHDHRGSPQSHGCQIQGNGGDTARNVLNPSSLRLEFLSHCRKSWRSEWFWAIAAGAPLILAWLVTRIEIAPVFHYRFMIAVALPLYLFAGTAIIRLPSAWLRWFSVLGTMGWMVMVQGTWGVWQDGNLMGEIRQEDWRQATRYISERFDIGQDVLWCSAGLIEGRSVIPPLSSHQNTYLSYPLRGCYQVVASGVTIEPHALVGQSRYWAEQLTEVAPVESTRGVASDDLQERKGTGRIWIVYRGTGLSLERRLQQAGLNQLRSTEPLVQFGRVSVVCLE